MRRRRKKRSEKTGLPPGALVHIGRQDMGDAVITATRYDAASLSVKENATVEDCRQIEDGSITWINVAGVHQPEIISKLGAMYNIHELSLEDIMNTEQMPKVDNHENYVFVVFRDLCDDPETPHEIEFSQVSIIIGANYLISFHESPTEKFESIRKRLSADISFFFKMGPAYLAYAIMDNVVDDYFPVIEMLDDSIYELEERTTGNCDAEDLKLIQLTRRRVIAVRRSAWPMRDVISKMQKRESPIIGDSVGIYLSDLYDHVVQVIDTTETFREVLSNVFDIYLTSASNKINEVMKVLAVIATIILPMTLITGMYGMNFKHMPELKWQYGYPMAIGMMLSIAAGMLFFFKKRKWF